MRPLNVVKTQVKKESLVFEPSYRTLFLSKSAKLSHRDHQLIITQDEIYQIPLKDIAYIIMDSPQISLSSSLLSALAEYKILLFTCDASHMPNGNFLPYLSHYRNSRMLEYQLRISQKTKAILWQKIIKAKIYNQAMHLRMQNQIQTALKLESLHAKVLLSDSSNTEAQAALLYFPALFGKNFKRKDENIINSALNYGYAILRGAIARSIVAAGLLPSFGIFHDNQFNPFNLADDLIEPYRVFVDCAVLAMPLQEGGLSTQQRAYLANILQARVLLGDRAYPISRAIIHSAQEFARIIRGEQTSLALPVFGEKSDGREIYEGFGDV